MVEIFSPSRGVYCVYVRAIISVRAYVLWAYVLVYLFV